MSTPPFFARSDQSDFPGWRSHNLVAYTHECGEVRIGIDRVNCGLVHINDLDNAIGQALMHIRRFEHKRQLPELADHWLEVGDLLYTPCGWTLYRWAYTSAGLIWGAPGTSYAGMFLDLNKVLLVRAEGSGK